MKHQLVPALAGLLPPERTAPRHQAAGVERRLGPQSAHDFAGTKTARQCGACTLCCKLLPVNDLGKLAGHRCAHQRLGKGCAIYATRPGSCRLWMCAWLQGDPDLRRPDLIHAVVDVMPDFVTTVDNETGARTKVPVVQVWVDPKFPDAHRDPALRAFLLRMATDHGMPALIRYDSATAWVLVAPPLSSTRDWVEMRSQTNVVSEEPHSAADVARAMHDWGLQTVITTAED